MKRRWNWRIWAGFGVALVASFSYVPLFIRYPLTRDFPWANVLLFVLAAMLVGGGLWRAFREPSIYRGRIGGSMVAAIVLLLFGLFAAGTFFAARSLPPATVALRVGQAAPDFQLAATDGTTVSLSQLRQGSTAVLLIFYRGYW